MNQGIKITPVSKTYKSLKPIEVHTVLIQTRSFYFGVVIPKSGSLLRQIFLIKTLKQPEKKMKVDISLK